MTIGEANQRLLFQLYHIYDDREAANIADMIMEHLTGWKRPDRIVNKQVKLSQPMEEQLENHIARLTDHTPVQYVLQEAWFFGMPFFVDGSVLIPRPETEELVDLVIRDNSNKGPLTVLDIGTGSGCIAIALQKKLKETTVFACDISEQALEVAAKNAQQLKAEIQFLKADILQPKDRERLPAVDIIVSNPPYIPVNNKKDMRDNVIRYEPHLALFVENEDPLLFYRTIATMHAPGVYVEIHEDFARETADLFLSNGYGQVEIKKDMQGKERMIRAVR